MHPGDAQTVARHADEADQPLLARGYERLDRAARPVGGVPLVSLDEVVQLDEINAFGAQALQRTLEAAARAVCGAVAGLRCHEEPVGMGSKPRCDPQLGLAVAGCDVEVVDARVEDER